MFKMAVYGTEVLESVPYGEVKLLPYTAETKYYNYKIVKLKTY